MWSLIGLTAGITLVLLVIFLGLIYFKPPVYRLTAKNLITLFELALSGEATESDWDIFIGVPIRYDDDLENIRLTCEELTEKKAVYADSKRRLCLEPEARRALEGFIQALSL
ncbi:MAG: hypothetical protein RLN82_02955 [Pseudomonadales bacterium]